MLRLLSDFSETLTLADEMIWVQRSEEGFAGIRTALSTRVLPVLLWYFLAFVWVCRYFLPPLFAITQPIVTQVTDGAAHYHAYSEDLPEGSYVSAEVREAHWVGMGYWEESTKLGPRSNNETLHTYHQYLFLQAMTAQGESILIPMVDTFTSESLILNPEIGEFFRSCSALAEEINQSGSFSLLGKIQRLDYPGTLQPGVPLWLNPDLSGMDGEMRELLPGVQGAVAQDLSPEEFLERLTQSEQENQLFTPETMGVFVLEEPPEEGTPLYREEKVYFLQHPVQFLRCSVQTGSVLVDVFTGAAMFGLLIALKRGRIPHVVVR